MSKAKSAFFCQNCGHEAAQWLGKCPSCKEWNTFVEERTDKTPKHVVSFSKSTKAQKAVLIQEVKKSEESRIALKDFELNRVLGAESFRARSTYSVATPALANQPFCSNLPSKSNSKYSMFLAKKANNKFACALNALA